MLPTAAVTPMASAPHRVTRHAPSITGGPPARAANTVAHIQPIRSLQWLSRCFNNRFIVAVLPRYVTTYATILTARQFSPIPTELDDVANGATLSFI